MPKITKRAVDGLKPGPARRWLWDADLKGFGVCVHPKSTRHPAGLKAFSVRYRTLRGRDRRLKLGNFGALTVEQARKLASKVLAEAQAGGDPAADRQTARGAPTFVDLAERYCAEHLVKKKAKSQYEDRRIIKTILTPAWGSRRVAEITASDVSRLHAGMVDRPVMANRALALASTMLGFGERWGLRPDNPARHVRRYPEKSRDRVLSPEELSRLGSSLKVADGENQSARNVAAAVRLIALTGCRKSEILSLTWPAVDTDARCLRLRDTKSGDQIKRLGPEALAVLAGIPRRVSLRVFPSPKRPDAPLSNIRNILVRILERAAITGASLHTLRHTKATIAADLGYSELIVGAMLGHSKGGSVTAGYTHLSQDPLVYAEERVQKEIWERLTAKPKGKVSSLENARLNR